MKTALSVIAVAGSTLISPLVSQAGQSEWATAGKVLTGVVAAGVVAEALRPHTPPPPVVVYQQPAPGVVYSAPASPTVVYAYPPAPVVVYAPAPSPVVVVGPSRPYCYGPVYRPVVGYWGHHRGYVRFGGCW